ncbi:MAG: TetR/AcrR family transcriptional regulator [Dermatophilaceae bacterium]
MPPEKSLSRQPRRDAARNRAALLAAAAALYRRSGPEVALDHVAREAGLGIGTLYRHFPTRRALVEAIVEERLDRLVEMLEKANATPDAWAAVTDVVRRFTLAQADDGALADVVASHLDARPETARRRASVHDLLHQLMTRAVADRQMRGDVTAADVLAITCGVRSVVGTARTARERRHVADRYVDVILAGLAAR